eukprot:COSAG02_NODE_4797_length_4965_cov_30.380395_4_plen_465_part_01
MYGSVRKDLSRFSVSRSASVTGVVRRAAAAMRRPLLYLGMMMAATSRAHAQGTQVGLTFIHCLPGEGMIESLEECQAAATTVGLPWASAAGPEWASGCVSNGGSVYYSDHEDGTTQNPTDAYICNVAGPVLTYTHCLPGEGMIETIEDCQAAAASIGATWASGAGTEWASGCLFHNGVVYYSGHEEGTTQDQADGYICNPPRRNCAGDWSTCGTDCADKTYTVTTAASGGGAACPAADGDTAACAAGEGDCPAAAQSVSCLTLSAAFDGPLSGGTPKGVELYVSCDIADLSAYGIGSANNGGGSDGQEFTFPQGDSATAGSYIIVAADTAQFQVFFGYAPDYVDSAVTVNGDDAVEIFMDGQVVDLYGAIDVDGSGQPWDYLDSWVYRNDGAGPSATFDISEWQIAGVDALEGLAANDGTVPLKTYASTSQPASEQAQDCAGDWSTCGTDCADKTYTVTTAASGG